MKKGFEKVENLRERMDVTHMAEGHPILRLPKTFRQKAADNLTKWAGSWTFILGFMILLFIWIGMNAFFLINYNLGNPFDPYPFILLNLVLSCLAAMQAPVILMSQNRAAQKDRIKAQYDYEVNVKAEKEIREMQKELKNIKIILSRKK